MANVDSPDVDEDLKPLFADFDAAMAPALAAIRGKGSADSEASGAPDHEDKAGAPAIGPSGSDDARAAERHAGAEEGTGYTFPFLDEPIATPAITDNELIEQLLEVQSRGAKGYADRRKLACAIHLELNRRGQLAPRFRPRPRARKRVPGVPYADTALSNDTQVIDLHWLHHRKAKLTVSNPEWMPLADAREPFDFRLASRLVAKGGSPARKADEILRIRPTVQLQLAALQSKSLAGRWRVIEHGRDDAGGEQLGMEDVRMLLEELANGNAVKMQTVEDRTLLWACWRLCGDDGSRLARLFALATGKAQQDTSNIRRRLQRLQKLLP